MIHLGDGKDKEYWIDYIRTIRNDSSLSASTYTIVSWCQEIGNFNSIESPHNVKSGLISCWNLWIQDIRAEYPYFFNLLVSKKFFDSGTTFLNKLNTVAKISHKKIFRINQTYHFHKIFEKFNDILQTSVCILQKKFPNRPQERKGLSHIFKNEPIVKSITTTIIAKVDPSSDIFNKVPATSE